MNVPSSIVLAALVAGSALGAVPTNEVWSLKPLSRPAVPAVKGVSNPIDAFVVAKLREHQLEPSPEADRRTLIRRLYFDLTGLPPTPAEITTFVADGDPLAYERLVDRLLDSPRHGERWARHWLDVVHYGDTHGYDKDKPRPNAWPYRDYVIRAFNADKPWARFVQEQVAGDVLFPDTRDGIEALGFIAAGPWDFISHAEVPESKTDGKIARHLDRDDMVSTTIQSFNSLTIQCAQCHDHKFDPIPQMDYYNLQAVFAALDRADKKYFTNAATTARFNELDRRSAALTERRRELEEKIKKLGGAELEGVEKEIAKAAGGGNVRAEFGYHSAIAAKQDAVKWVQVDLGRSTVLDRIVVTSCYDDFNGIGAGFGFPLRFKIEASDDPEFRAGVISIVARLGADVKNLATTTPRTFPASGAMARFIRVTATKLAPRKNDFIFALAELQVFDSTGADVSRGAKVSALDSIEAPPRWRKVNLVDSVAPANDDAAASALRAKRDALVARVADEATRNELADVTKRLAETKTEIGKMPQPDVVFAGTIHHGSGNFRGTGPDGGKPRAIHLLERGNVLKPGAEAVPGSLSAVKTLPARFVLPATSNEGDRRAALAKWLTDANNPLTWRSVVNRVWHHHFGRGIVETPNDFGLMGARPTHPELLDWLAVEFRDGGGSLKKLHKLIVTSATYRQRSDGTAGIGVDSGSRLLWRKNRTKLDAESVRDALLFVSGKLDLMMGGPGYQDFVIKRPEHSPHYQYDLHDPDDPKSHRRSVYRFIVRSQLEPMMTALDCADPSMQVARRNESVSPLQALALLNNGLAVTMARHFAAKLDAGGGDISAKLARGFAEATGRTPTASELKELTGYANQHGLANACRVIFNLNEFHFVD